VRQILKVLAVNLLVFFALLGALFAFMFVRGIERAEDGYDSRAELPNYAGVAWAARHFREVRDLDTEYFSYIGWRRKPFAGETINVVGEHRERRTVPQGDAGKPLVYFFGGSTMWGTGADDASTIPSLFARQTGYRARNFGESGYTAHQSLAMLLRLLQDGHRPDIVVFYDGVNEVAAKCRAEVGPHSTSREARFRQQIEAGVGTPAFYLLAVQKVFGRRAGPGERQYDCDTNPGKAEAIVAALLHDWQLARTISEARGIRFYGVLQPVSHFGRSRTEHLRLDAALARQYRHMYPRLAERVEREGLPSVAGTLDADEFLYIDFCHLSPEGNRRVAAKLATIVR
jgi:hypothetical protein